MPEPVLPEALRDLPGTVLTPGTIEIGAAESAQLAEVLGSPAPSGMLHPVYAYIAAQRGIGVSVAELCELADFDVEDGPLLGAIDLRWEEELRPDTEYRVEGEVVDIRRKEGRSAGVFDLFTFEERLVTAAGSPVSSARVSFVLPRKQGQA